MVVRDACPEVYILVVRVNLSRCNHWLPGCEAHPEVMQSTADVQHEGANAFLKIVPPDSSRGPGCRGPQGCSSGRALRRGRGPPHSLLRAPWRWRSVCAGRSSSAQSDCASVGPCCVFLLIEGPWCSYVVYSPVCQACALSGMSLPLSTRAGECAVRLPLIVLSDRRALRRRGLSYTAATGPRWLRMVQTAGQERGTLCRAATLTHGACAYRTSIVFYLCWYIRPTD